MALDLFQSQTADAESSSPLGVLQCGSRSLNAAEQNYSTIEIECLAIQFWMKLKKCGFFSSRIGEFFHPNRSPPSGGIIQQVTQWQWESAPPSFAWKDFFFFFHCALGCRKGKYYCWCTESQSSLKLVGQLLFFFSCILDLYYKLQKLIKQLKIAQNLTLKFSLLYVMERIQIYFQTTTHPEW